MITTIELPTEFFNVKAGTFRPMPVQSIFQSDYVPEGLRIGGARFQRWVCDVELAVAEREVWQKYEAFIADVSDRPCAFTLYDPSKELPLGLGAGYDPDSTPQHWEDPDTSEQHFDEGHWIDGATFCTLKTAAPRYANSIVVSGLPVSSVVLKAGDNFSIGGNIYMVTGDTRSDVNGDARIDFVWKLHKPALPGDIVDFILPKGRFILIDPNSGTVMKSVAGHGTYNLKAVEVPFT